MSENLTAREKLAAIYDVVKFRPVFAFGVVSLSLIAAILEGIGLSFILPIVEYARGIETSNPDGPLGLFIDLYELLGVPFSLEYLVIGVALVMMIRYTARFLVAWFRIALRVDYERHIRRGSYEGALDAKIRYFDEQGSDEILNAIITQSTNASRVIQRVAQLLEIGLVSLVYLVVAVYMAPSLTLFAIIILGTATLITRNIFEGGFSVGGRVADANERIQEAVQAGTQGIRDAKLFGMKQELLSEFQTNLDRYVEGRIKQKRNSAGIDNFHQLISALAVFLLIYAGIQYSSLSIGSLGVFLFAMFRLAPRASTLNNVVYNIEADLPHLVRAQWFIEEVDEVSERSGGTSPPENVQRIEFQNVSFSYDGSEQVLDNVSFHAKTNESIAFVGESGAGKSTIVSLLSRMYEPDSGTIQANGTSIYDFDIIEWREQVAVVRQSPFIFNETLRNNITIGDRDATDEEIRRVAEIARVDAFLDELPNGFDTYLGDEGVRLSGGQKQRVALARALLKDADILILDEATSDLDTNLEAEVQDAIESLNEDYIVLTVAHRLSTVVNSDRIYTVVDGAITDSGRHKELLERGGKYAELYS
jgi:subfamily B ATP-binding cassette protein MsbA